jgi:sodium/proline symporter
MIVAAIIIVGYTCFGGFLAASHTDLVQSIVMTIALIVVVFLGINYAGGWENVSENAKSLPGYLSMNATYNAETGTADSYGILKIISTLAWGLGYFGMPHILLRFMAIRSSKEIKISRRIASVWVVISMFVAILIGVVGLGITAHGTFETLADSETIVIRIAELMSKHGIFLAIIAGLIVSGILACTMSTSDSQLLAASSSASENLIKGMFGVKLSDKASMIVARVTLVVIAAIGVVIAWNPNSSVFDIVSFAWAGFGAAFGPVVLAALFWKRSNKYGALAGMIVGGITVFVWKYVVRPLGGAWDIYELLPAFVAAIIAIVAVSLLTAEPEKEIYEEFEQVKSME